MIMYLTGVLTMLNYFDRQLRNYILKGNLNVVRNSIKNLLVYVRECDYERSFYKD